MVDGPDDLGANHHRVDGVPVHPTVEMTRRASLRMGCGGGNTGHVERMRGR